MNGLLLIRAAFLVVPPVTNVKRFPRWLAMLSALLGANQLRGELKHGEVGRVAGDRLVDSHVAG